MKVFFGKFFWGFVSNEETDVSTGAVLAIGVILAWIFQCLWVTLHPGLTLKVGPLELSALVVALAGIPKAAFYLGKKGEKAPPGCGTYPVGERGIGPKEAASEYKNNP